MVWGCMTPQGVGYMCKIDGRMDAELYTSIFYFFLHHTCAAGCRVEGWTSHDTASLTLRMRNVL